MPGEGMSVYAWLLGTALIFTAVGWRMGRQTIVYEVVESTIDSLIEDGYLKTRGHGEEQELILWRDWESK